MLLCDDHVLTVAGNAQPCTTLGWVCPMNKRFKLLDPFIPSTAASSFEHRQAGKRLAIHDCVVSERLASGVAIGVNPLEGLDGVL